MPEPKAHVSHAEIEGANGKVRKWWRLDFASPKGVIAAIMAWITLLGILWGIYAVVTVSVLDPHIRTIVRDEVPKAMVSFVDEAVTRASRPHMESARLEHKMLQDQITSQQQAIVQNREEREKFQRELAQRDAEARQDLQAQRQEIAALRQEVMRLNATVLRIYALMKDGKGVEP